MKSQIRNTIFTLAILLFSSPAFSIEWQVGQYAGIPRKKGSYYSNAKITKITAEEVVVEWEEPQVISNYQTTTNDEAYEIELVDSRGKSKTRDKVRLATKILQLKNLRKPEMVIFELEGVQGRHFKTHIFKMRVGSREIELDRFGRDLGGKKTLVPLDALPVPPWKKGHIVSILVGTERVNVIIDSIDEKKMRLGYKIGQGVYTISVENFSEVMDPVVEESYARMPVDMTYTLEIGNTPVYLDAYGRVINFEDISVARIRTSLDEAEEVEGMDVCENGLVNAPDQRVISEQVNLEEYPNKVRFHRAGDQVTIGDMHGNTLKFIHFLIREGFLELNEDLESSKAIYRRLKGIYNRSKELKLNDLEEFEEILREARIKQDAPKLRSLGDELADRGNNDLLTILLLEKVLDSEKLEIIQSNHSFKFLRHYSDTGAYKSDSTTSLQNMKKFLETPEGSLYKNRVNSFVEKVYRPNLKIISYSRIPSKRLSIYTHAPVGTEGIGWLAKDYGINCSGFFHSEETAMKCIDAINDAFRGDNSRNSVQYVTENRDYSHIKQPEKLRNGTRLYFVHGHDSEDENRHSHVTCLDNGLGKSSTATKGIYEVYVDPTILESEKVTSSPTKSKRQENEESTPHKKVKISNF